MAETVFSCSCGMILKVYGDQEAGTRIECPSCKAKVIVPPTGRASVAPHFGEDAGEEVAKQTDRSNLFLYSYMLVLFLGTLGVLYYLLGPTTRGPDATVKTVAVDRQATAESVTEEKAKAPTKIARKFAKRWRRKDVEPVEPDTEPPLPVYETSSTSTEPPVSRPPVPDRPRTEEPERPAMETPRPSDPEPPAPRTARIPRPTADAPYANISNRKARLSLTFALKNSTNARATLTAEVFLKRAEQEAPGDPEVMAEIKKLRAKIARVRDRAIPKPSPFGT